jgi:hypothetical protein
LNALSYLDGLWAATAGFPETRLLVKAGIVVHAVNLLDLLYPPLTSAPAGPTRSFLELMRDDDRGGLALLEAGHRARDSVAETEIRAVRNVVGAHVDEGTDLPELRRRLRRLRTRDLAGTTRRAAASFQRACLADWVFGPSLRMHMSAIPDAASALDTSAINSYSPEQQ